MTVRLKKKIIQDIQSLNDPNLLGQLVDFLNSLRRQMRKPQQNRDAVFRFAGLLSDEDAAEVTGIIDQEFNSIEGEW